MLYLVSNALHIMIRITPTAARAREHSDCTFPVDHDVDRGRREHNMLVKFTRTPGQIVDRSMSLIQHRSAHIYICYTYAQNYAAAHSSPFYSIIDRRLYV